MPRSLQALHGLQRESSHLQFHHKKKLKKYLVLSLAFFVTSQSAFAEVVTLTASRPFAESVSSYQARTLADVTQPMIIHIEDAHGVFEIQKNISQLVARLVSDYGFDTVFEEGNHGRIDPSHTFWFTDVLNKRAASAFLREGKITGAEHALVLNPGSFGLFGVEDDAWYRKNLAARDEVMFYQNSIGDEIRRIEKSLVRRLSRTSKDLLDYLRQSDGFWLGEAPPPFDLPMNDTVSIGEAMVKQVAAIDDMHREALIRSAEERELAELWKGLGYFRKMSRLALTRDEFDALSGKAGIEKISNRSVLLRDFYQAVRRYYEIASRRDHEMARRTVEMMKEKGVRRAVLVAGGFHSEGIEEYIRKQNISFMTVRPLQLAAAETLREPNLFNLNPDEARLFADLKILQMTEGGKARIREAILQDAKRLMERTGSRPNTAPALPATLQKNAAIVIAARSMRSSDLETLLKSMGPDILNSQIPVIVAARTAADVRSLRNVSRRWGVSRIDVRRVLTSSESGALSRSLSGRFVILLASEGDLSLWESAGIPYDLHLPARISAGVSGEERLLKELDHLRETYRSVMLSA